MTPPAITVLGRKFLGDRNGGWHCGPISVRYIVSSAAILGTFLATAPGMSARGNSVEAAATKLLNRAARALAAK